LGVSGSCGCSGDDVCGGSDGDDPALLSPQPALTLVSRLSEDLGCIHKQFLLSSKQHIDGQEIVA
jgi:hypothetical protein